MKGTGEGFLNVLSKEFVKGKMSKVMMSNRKLGLILVFKWKIHLTNFLSLSLF